MSLRAFCAEARSERPNCCRLKSRTAACEVSGSSASAAARAQAPRRTGTTLNIGKPLHTHVKIYRRPGIVSICIEVKTPSPDRDATAPAHAGPGDFQRLPGGFEAVSGGFRVPAAESVG